MGAGITMDTAARRQRVTTALPRVLIMARATTMQLLTAPITAAVTIVLGPITIPGPGLITAGQDQR